MLLGGVVSRMLMIAFAGKDPAPFKQGDTYGFIAGLIFCLVSQTHFLNRGLETGDVMAVYPVFQAFWILFGTIGSVVLYWPTLKNEPGQHESAHGLKNDQKVHYAIACACMVVGVTFLLRHRHRSYRDREDARAKADAADDVDTDDEDSETLDTIDEHSDEGGGHDANDLGGRRARFSSHDESYEATHATDVHPYEDADVSGRSLRKAVTHNLGIAPGSPLPKAPTMPAPGSPFHGSDGKVVKMEDMANPTRASAEDGLNSPLLKQAPSGGMRMSSYGTDASVF